jgi:transposase-like protein
MMAWKQQIVRTKRHRFPLEIIQHAVWLYHRFNLGHRDIEDLLAARGIAVSYESIRLGVTSLVPDMPGG